MDNVLCENTCDNDENENEKIMIDDGDFPYFLYNKDVKCNPTEPYKGLFHGYLLVWVISISFFASI